MDTSNSRPLSNADYIVGKHTVNGKELTASEWEEILKHACGVVAPIMKYVPFVRILGAHILSDDLFWNCHPLFKGENATCSFGIEPSDGTNTHLTDYTRLVPIADMVMYRGNEKHGDTFVEEYLLKASEDPSLWAVLLRTLSFKRDSGGSFTVVGVESMSIHGISIDKVAQRALLNPDIGVKALVGLERALNLGIKKKEEHLDSLAQARKTISSMVDRVTVK